MATEPLEQELWRRYRQDGDPQAKDFLFLRYAPWARKLASYVYSRVRVPILDWGDFVQNASLGLIEAMQRFDHERGIEFTKFAAPRVRGAVINGLRMHLDLPSPPPEPDRYSERLRLLADDDPQDDLMDVVDAVVGLGVGYLLETMADDCTAGVEGPLAAQQANLYLREALNSLNERELAVIAGHYFNYLPFHEIASEFNLSRGRIAQIHKAALGRLRLALRNLRLDASCVL